MRYQYKLVADESGPQGLFDIMKEDKILLTVYRAELENLFQGNLPEDCDEVLVEFSFCK